MHEEQFCFLFVYRLCPHILALCVGGVCFVSSSRQADQPKTARFSPSSFYDVSAEGTGKVCMYSACFGHQRLV